MTLLHFATEFGGFMEVATDGEFDTPDGMKPISEADFTAAVVELDVRRDAVFAELEKGGKLDIVALTALEVDVDDVPDSARIRRVSNEGEADGHKQEEDD